MEEKDAETAVEGCILLLEVEGVTFLKNHVGRNVEVHVAEKQINANHLVDE